MAIQHPRFGALTFISGPEQFLAERAVDDAVAALLEERTDALVTRVSAGDLSVGRLDELVNGTLFSPDAIVVVLGAESLPKDVEPALLALIGAVPDSLGLVVAHSAGPVGSRALLKALGGAAGITIDCPAMKARDLPGFVAAEARRGRGHIDRDTAQQLIDAVGQDTRALAAAVAQLLSDAEDDTITVAQVTRYFSGRATVTSFAVADDALAGRTGEAIVKLRWAIETGVAPVLVTAAVANSLRQTGRYLALSRQGRPSAADVGVPPWKLADIAQESRSWSEQSVASALRAVCQADAEIKGAAADADYALERLLLRLGAIRKASHVQ